MVVAIDMEITIVEVEEDRPKFSQFIYDSPLFHCFALNY